MKKSTTFKNQIKKILILILAIIVIASLTVITGFLKVLLLIAFKFNQNNLYIKLFNMHKTLLLDLKATKQSFKTYL